MFYIYYKKAFVMKLVDILVLGTSAERRAGSSPAEGIKLTFNVKSKFVLYNTYNDQG